MKWLNGKADTLLKRDKRRGKPYAQTATKSFYKKEIHKAVMKSGEKDPFTGAMLEWKLICTWDPHDQPDGYRKKFYHIPTVDHVVGDVLEFEICSLQVNDSKIDMSPDEFIEFCAQVTAYRMSAVKSRA